MEYREFFHIEIKHLYFSGIPEDLILVVESETKRRLNTLGFLLKKTAKGVQVLAPVDEARTNFPSLEEEAIFSFFIYPTSAYIQEITDLSNIKKGKMISFTNEGLKTNEFDLSISQIDQRGIFHGFTALAYVAISGQQVTDSLGENPPRFQAIFNPKSVKWKYYFVTNSKNTAINLESREEQIGFRELVINENTLDQVTVSLQLNFPNMQIKVFESDDAIPYSNKPIKNMKLLQNGDVLIGHLPNPKREQQGVQIIKI